MTRSYAVNVVSYGCLSSIRKKHSGIAVSHPAVLFKKWQQAYCVCPSFSQSVCLSVPLPLLRLQVLRLCVCACVQVGIKISGLPEGFNPHKGIKRVFEGRRKMMDSGEGVDWGFAEALAFGTLVSEGERPNPQAC